ncbi:hypothetical protein NSQ54_08325 [Alkalihalobacillus sp. FSL W8-0930]
MKSFLLMIAFMFFGVVGGYLVPLFLHDIVGFPIELPICVLLGLVLSMQVLNYMTQTGLLEKIAKRIT